MNKKIILIIVIIIAVGIGFFVYRGFIREDVPEFVYEKVVRGTVAQEVLETGTVKAAKEIDLSFKSFGRIEEIYVEVGQEVKVGQKLIRKDTDHLEIQLAGAKASLSLAQAGLNRLLAGASPEEIKIIQTQIESAQIAFNIAQQNLKDSYEATITVLKNSLPQICNSLDFVRRFIKEYIDVFDEDARKIVAIRNEIKEMESRSNFYLEKAKKDPTNHKNINAALSIMRNSLEKTFNNLEEMREIIDESVVFRDIVSPPDKVLLVTLRTNTNSALAKIINNQHIISSRKFSVERAKTGLQEAKNHLVLITVEARQVDIAIHNAKIKQTQAKIDLLKERITEAVLKSPIQGVVGQVNQEIGEMVSAGIPIISLISVDDFQVEVDIFEEDIVKIEIGNPAEITLIAFPDKPLIGRVISIDPIERLIGGVVHYRVTIDFEEEKSGIKSGMTADIIIKIAIREDVLKVYEDFLQEKNGQFIVQVLKNDLIQDRIIEIGLRGDDDMVEIISGLKEGEKVIIK